MTDFELDLLANRWVHPETECVILGEDMPWELMPAGPTKFRYASLAAALKAYGLTVTGGDDD